MYKAKLISTHHNIDLWQITGNGEKFTTEFMRGATVEQIEEYFNN